MEMVKFKGHIILETSVNTMYRFTIIKGGDFQSEQEAEDFLRINLGDKFIELFNNETFGEIESNNDSFVDSLISSAVIKSRNLEFKKSILLLDEAERITSIQSEKYQSILKYKLYIFMCIRDFKKSEEIFKKINKTDPNNNTVFEVYDEIEMLILLETGRLEEAKSKKSEYEVKFDSYDVSSFVSFPYYSYICYKFRETDKAINLISKYIEIFLTKNDELEDNSYYLIRAMYNYENKDYISMLYDTEQSLLIDLSNIKFNNIRANLWHSLALYKLYKQDEAISCLQNALEEKMIHDPEDKVPISMLLSPYPGIFPSEEVYEDLDFLMNLIQKNKQ